MQNNIVVRKVPNLSAIYIVAKLTLFEPVKLNNLQVTKKLLYLFFLF